MSLILLLLITLVTFANANVVLYFLPFGDIITSPKGCSIIVNNKTNFIERVCDKVCSYSFSAKDIFGYISFNLPRSHLKEVIQYGYYINEGINNFKIFEQECPKETCHPIVSYLIDKNLSMCIVEIINQAP